MGDWCGPYSSRSIERITLTTTAPSFRQGYPITVTVSIFCSTSLDYVHLYVSASTSPISWSFVGSAKCVGAWRVENKTFTYIPPNDGWYVIRAVVTGSTPSTCPNNPTSEVDDVAGEGRGSSANSIRI